MTTHTPITTHTPVTISTPKAGEPRSGAGNRPDAHGTRSAAFPSRKGIAAALLAASGALAYTISKVDLAFRGELGLPGFTAPAASYLTHDAFSGQLGNAGLGLLMAGGILLLLAAPRRRWMRVGLLLLNGAGAAMIAVSTVLFGARALGVAPALGTPAEGISSWVSVGVGVLWSVAWWVAIVCGRRGGRS